MEEMIHSFKNNSDGFKVPNGSVYSVIEAPKGETGVFLISDNSVSPYRCIPYRQYTTDLEFG